MLWKYFCRMRALYRISVVLLTSFVAVSQDSIARDFAICLGIFLLCLIVEVRDSYLIEVVSAEKKARELNTACPPAPADEDATPPELRIYN